MPYKLRKAPGRDAYWVVNTDTKAKHSKDPIPKDRAEAQMRVLVSAEQRETEDAGDALRSLRHHDKNEVARTLVETPDIIDAEEEENEYEKEEAARSLAKMRKGKGRRRKRGGMEGDEGDDEELAEIFGKMDMSAAAPVERPAAPVPKRRGRRPKARRAEDIPKMLPHKRKFDEFRGRATEGGSFLSDVMAVKKSMKGGGPIPPRNELQIIAEGAYKNAPQQVGNLKLISRTPTLVFYEYGNTIVVGIRGTVPTDLEDVKSDGAIAVGLLNRTPRFLTDLATLKAFQVNKPPAQYDYYGVGHSLGGAILDAFLKMGLLKKGVSYNPAVQPQDIISGQSTNNERIYEEGDPLYKVMGQFTRPKPEVRKSKKKASLISKIPILGKAYDYLTSHALGNFEGGAFRLYPHNTKKVISDVTNEVVASFSSREKAIEFLNHKMKLWKEAIKDASEFFDEVEDEEMVDENEIATLLHHLAETFDLSAAEAKAAFEEGYKKSKGEEWRGSGSFKEDLHETGLSPEAYLKHARAAARKHGYPAHLLGFADDGVHKLQIPNGEGRIVKFGRVGYGDFILWTDAEKHEEVPRGYAKQKRDTFHASHSKIRGRWKKDPFSPNNLALKILW